jgi:hypothetical protein
MRIYNSQFRLAGLEHASLQEIDSKGDTFGQEAFSDGVVAEIGGGREKL